MDNLIAFSIVAAALVASPGPDSILILKNTIASGRLPGIATVIGVQAGISAHAMLSLLGLSTILYYSPLIFRLLAFVGALYLAYIGYATIKHGITPPEYSQHNTTLKRGFLQGMLCNLLNPKVIILFITLMPTFINFSDGNPIQQIIILVGILLAINIPFQIGLVLIAAQVYKLMAATRVAQYIQWTLGIILLFFAVLLFVEHTLAIKN